MSKASDYKKHSDSMIYFSPSGEQQAIVHRDGTLFICRIRETDWSRDTGMCPEHALAFGRWLVDMFEEKE